MKTIRAIKGFSLFWRGATQKRILCLLLSLIIALTAIPSVSAARVEDSAGVDLGLDCKSAILMEASTGSILYEQNADMPLPPASVTKIMTLLLIMEAIEDGRIKYSDTVRVSANASSMGGSQIYLEEGEELSVEDLLKSVVIASANDAAVALAEHVAGSEDVFVERMNKRAQELGMKNTSFENTNGLDDTTDSHLTSARDIAIMSRALLKYPKITEFASIWMDSIRGGEFVLTNTNRLVRFYRGATGLKTGSTSKAGFCISASAERDGMHLIAVIMGAPGREARNAAAASLLDHGFANYALFRQPGELAGMVKVNRGIESSVEAKYSDFSCLVPKNKLGAVQKKIELAAEISAPVREGDTLGNMSFTIDGREIGRVAIVASQNVEKVSFFEILRKLLLKCASFA